MSKQKEPTKAELMERIERLEAQVEDQDHDHYEPEESEMISRRDAIKTGGLLAALGIIPGIVAGDQQLQTKEFCEWEFNIDAQDNWIKNLRQIEGGVTGDSVLSNIAGQNLSIDSDGNLNASSGNSAGALTDSGSDNSAGGDQYVLPQATDSIDLEGQGGIQNGGPASFGSMTATESEVTGETSIRLTRQNDSSSTSAGDFINPYDTVDQDPRGEIDGNLHFIPDKTGDYKITVSAAFSGGSTQSGDATNCRIRDLDNGANLGTASQLANSSTFYGGIWAFPSVTLTAGTAYELEITNFDSSFVLSSADVVQTRIKWCVVQ